MVNATINGKKVCVEEGTTILQAARQIDIKIPTLCHNPDLPAWASCGICIVRMAGTAKMIRACCTAVTEGMNVITHDPQIVQARRTVLELILSNHPDDCLRCSRNNKCELQTLAAEFGLRTVRFDKILKEQPIDDSNDAIVLDRDKCINCGRCVEACQLMQNVWALEYSGRGDKTMIGPVSGVNLANSPCVRCGQCAVHCPTGAISSSHSNRKLWDRICDPEIVTAVQIAPSVRVAIGEEFGLEPGELSSRKIYTALRRIGFDYVFDTNFGADLTIMEEATEFVERLGTGGPFPMFTSCCPAWIKYLENENPKYLKNISTCKSPMQMFGALMKDRAKKMDAEDGRTTYHIAIMPCTAKKAEILRPDSHTDGEKDVDYVLTTNEIVRMIQGAGLDLATLPSEALDMPFGLSSGAAAIFGVTGGVTEAVLRRLVNSNKAEDIQQISFTGIRGEEGIKEATVQLGDREVKIAVVNGLRNAETVIQRIKSGEVYYDFVEVMACKRGCVAGGGQPLPIKENTKKARIEGLYATDSVAQIKHSNENPIVQYLYEGFLKGKEHKLLHTR